MQNKKMKLFAYMDTTNEERGITFISVLFSLAILLTTLPFLFFIFQSLPQKSFEEELSARQFFHFLRNELYASETVTIAPTSVSLKSKDGSEITIELYGNLIRRQVSGQGHEILVRNIKQVEFQAIAYGFHATVVTKGGETYEKSFSFY